MTRPERRCKVCGALESADNPLVRVARDGSVWLCLDAEACEARAVNWT